MFILFIIGFAIGYGILSGIVRVIGSALKPDIAPDKTKPVQLIVRKRVVMVSRQEPAQAQPSPVARQPRPAKIPDLVG